MKTKQKEKVKINSTLLNVISPIGLNFKKNSVDIGENTGEIYGVIKYPQSPEYGWLSKLTNIPGTVCSINISPVDNANFLENLSHSVSRNKAAASTTKDALVRSRAEKAAEDAEKMMVKIDQEGESVIEMGMSIMPISTEEEVLEKIEKKVKSSAAVVGCRVRKLAHLQKEGLKQLSPFHALEPKINQVINRVVPLSSFIGGYPFAKTGYTDGTGYYFAKDSLGGLIILDLWKRESDRTNSNITFMGVPGVGKSTALKHIALSEYMKGTKIIFIDPHREFREMTYKLGGDWINCGGGSKGRLNPLQVRMSPKDSEDEDIKLYEDEGQGIGDLALHLKNLEVFFKLYIPSLTDRQVAILKGELIELYNNFNIYWDTDIKELKNTDFPIMKNLYDQILEKSKQESPYKKDYEDLALLLKDIAIGGDSFLWNGHTTISTNSRCICLDTKDLLSSPKNIITTQYFSVLQWAWNEITKNPNERVMLFCDEAYLMIDPENPQSIAFLRNAAKGVRKSEGSIVVVSHSVVDFLDPKVRMYGEALLDLATYKIIMGTDGKNLQETKDLYNLTEAEEELVAAKKRGTALLLIGSKRLSINFDIPEYKFEYMGASGGR